MNTLEYFAPGFSSIEEVEAKYGPIQDASTLQKIADCPRKHQIRVEENLEKPGIDPKMGGGIALHEGLDVYYSYVERDGFVLDLAREAIVREWDNLGINRAFVDPGAAHICAEQLCEVFTNYTQYYGGHVIETLTPVLGLRLSDLCLDNVLAARFKIHDDETLVLNEASLVMRFDVEGETLVLAGKPDLPVEDINGRLYSVDHKTTSSYLSDYWAKSHQMANKDRGYMAMLQSLLQRRVHGTVINGIYIGEYATNPKSKTVKFHRYPFDFTPGHVAEALKNQLVWKKTADFYRSLGYFPQGCGYGGCAYPSICCRDPEDRAEVKRTDYQQSTRTFWGL